MMLKSRSVFVVTVKSSVYSYSYADNAKQEISDVIFALALCFLVDAEFGSVARSLLGYIKDGGDKVSFSQQKVMFLDREQLDPNSTIQNV